MARRLLGADSATVFNVQEPEEEAANQVCDPPGFPEEQCSPPATASLPRDPVLGPALCRAKGGSQAASDQRLVSMPCVEGVMELFPSMTPVLFVLAISFSSFKYLSDFPVLCGNAKQVCVEEHTFAEIV